MRQLVVAFQHGGRLPLWGKVLEASETWGTPPWEIAPNSTSRLGWFFRWLAYSDQRSKAR